MIRSWIMFLILIVIVILICNIKENWTMYEEKPYNYNLTGSSPLNYYRHDRYRKPYRYPFKFYTTYPTKDVSYLE
jgi:hypothetical protein